MKSWLWILLAGLALCAGCDEDDDDDDEATEEMAALETELNNRITAWLREMDLFIERRSVEYEDDMIAFMEAIFAPEFHYAVFDAEGNALFPEEGTYTVRDWVEGQEIGTATGIDGTMLAPAYTHFLTVVEPDRKVTLRGYHDHYWTGMFALAFRTTHEIGFDEFTFEKIDGEWLITSYVETVYEVSPCSEEGNPTPCQKPPPSPARGHPPYLPGLLEERPPPPGQ